jgi:hypothetical protein
VLGGMMPWLSTLEDARCGHVTSRFAARVPCSFFIGEELADGVAWRLGGDTRRSVPLPAKAAPFSRADTMAIGMSARTPPNLGPPAASQRIKLDGDAPDIEKLWTAASVVRERHAPKTPWRPTFVAACAAAVVGSTCGATPYCFGLHVGDRIAITVVDVDTFGMVLERKPVDSAAHVHLVNADGSWVEEKAKRFNSAVLATSDGRPQGIYDKRDLMAFGEYIPWESDLPVAPTSLPRGGHVLSRHVVCTVRCG